MNGLRIGLAKHVRLKTAALLMIVVLAACSSGTTSSTSHQPVTLKILMGGGNTTYWDALTKTFQQKYPWITLAFERVPGPDFQTKWNAYIAACGSSKSCASGPDVIWIQSGAVFLPYKQALQQLPELKADLSQFSGSQNFCDNFDCNKGIYGIPYNDQGYVLYYNKQVLQQAGLPLSAPKTWTEMANACTKIKALGKACIALGMKDFGEWQLAWGPLPNETMTLAQQEGFWGGQTKWTDPEVLAWFKVYQDAVKRGWFNPDAPSISQTPDAEGLFTSGKAAFIMGFVADIEDYATMGKALGDQNLDVGLFPSIEQNIPVPGVGPGPLATTAGISSATAFGLASWSQNKEAYLLWVRYVGTQENQQAYLEQVGVPSRIGLDSSKASPALKSIIKLMDPNGSLAVWYMGFKTQDALKNQMEQFFSNSTTPEAAVAAVQKAQDAP